MCNSRKLAEQDTTEVGVAMKVQVTSVGFQDHLDIEWPEGWPIPPEDTELDYDGQTLFVRTVVWYLRGEDDDKEPFVYIVVGPVRRGGAWQ